MDFDKNKNAGRANPERKMDIFDEEKHLVLDEEHDGIVELDNKMPTWWTWMFVVCVIFGYVYMAHYHYFGTGQLSVAEYETEDAIGRKQAAEVRAKLYASITPESVTAITDPTRLANGEKLFKEKCVACHGAQGQGAVGPNLTDNTWLYGCKIGDVFKLITEGSPDKKKGMQAWGAQLNPVQIQDIASYILTLPPAAGKAAEGAVCSK